MGTLALLAAIGLAAGVLSGLFGIGGGLLLVPALSLLGWPLPQAIGTSLLYVAAMGVGGAIAHYRRRNVDVAFVVAFSLPAIGGAQLGAWLSELTPAGWLELAFAAFLLFSAWQLVTTPVQERDGEAPALMPTLALGLGVGTLSGLFGVGGGLLFVPAQVAWFGIPIQRAVGNSLAGILLTGLSGVVAHGGLGHVAWQAGAVMIVGGLAGLRLGLWLLTRWPAARLKRAMAGLIVATAGYMAWSGIHHVFR